MGDILAFLYAELAYSVLISLVFGSLFVRKVIKLDKLGDNLEVKIPRRDWAKFVIILLIILLAVLHLVLAYSSSSYWLNGYANFSLTIFLYVGNYTMQCYIVLKSITKGNGHRYLPNLAFWTVCMSQAIIEIIVIERLNGQSKSSALLQFVLAVLNFGLLIISLLFDKNKSTPDILKSLRTDSDTGRTIEDSIHRWDRIPPSNRLYIEFNQQFEVNQQHKEGLSVVFKIAVYVDESVNIISKSDFDFSQLGLEMKKAFPTRPEVMLPQLSQKKGNMMEFGEERLKNNENYLLDLIRTGDLIVPCLLDFLEVPANLRSKLVMNDLSHLMRQDTVELSEEEKVRRPFFDVYIEKGKVILQNPDFLEFIINRTLADILQLYSRLKDEQRLTIDILPENPQLEDLATFFSIVVNKKSLWRSFSAWFRLDIQLQNKVYNYFDPWVVGFKNISVDIIGHQVIFDGDGKIHTCYLISLVGSITRRRPSHSESDPRGVILKKRFSQFCILDKHIRRFMGKRKMSTDGLPALPPKFSPFGSKTSPRSRQMRFGMYMMELLRIEGINQCIKLLEFLEFDSVNSMQETNKTPEAEDNAEQSQLSYFSQLNEK